MLLSTPERLAATDIAQHALEQLSASRIREVVVVGRRGPAEAAFTNGELLGLLGVPGVEVVVDPRGLDLAADTAQNLTFAAAQKSARLAGLVGEPSGDGPSGRVPFLRVAGARARSGPGRRYPSDAEHAGAR